MEVLLQVWILQHQYEVIYLCNSISIILVICALYNYDFVGIYVAIVLVIYMFYDSSYISISSCFYLQMNEQCIYDLMDEMEIDVLRN